MHTWSDIGKGLQVKWPSPPQKSHRWHPPPPELPFNLDGPVIKVAFSLRQRHSTVKQTAASASQISRVHLPVADTQGGHLLCDVSILRIDASKKRIAVADPDLQIRGGGRSYRPWDKGGGVAKNFFCPFRPQFGLKIRGGPAPPLDLPNFSPVQ